jgi:hypothetical protein
MKSDSYYLFGEEVVNIYNDGGLDELIEAIKTGCTFSTIHYNTDEHTPNDLLNNYDGYFAWCELDKLEYDTLQKAITEL